MYGFNHIPLAQRAIQVDEFTFYSGAAASLLGVIPYRVPTNAAFLYIKFVGAGADGGTPTVGAGVSGGGGGGSGAIMNGLFPTILLPSVIYIRLGTPSIGASFSGVFISPSISAGDRILSVANGRVGATTGAGGVGGVNTPLGVWGGTTGMITAQAGATGGAGSTTNGAAVTALATLPLTGGGGGGGSSAGTGGNITGAGPFPTISGGASGLNPGNGGMMLRQPFGGVGGSGGGGSSGAGTGANFGGPGAIGCGGGGGGNAASGTPGAGGKGGPGYCLIVAF